MTRAILLLDAECGPCSDFGKRIEDEGLIEGSVLEIGSLHDELYREYVGKMEPPLVCLDAGLASVSTGWKLAVDLVKLLGMRRAYRVAVLVRSATADASFDRSRRSFLVKMASAVASDRFMAAVVDTRSNTVRSALDIDASEVVAPLTIDANSIRKVQQGNYSQFWLDAPDYWQDGAEGFVISEIDNSFKVLGSGSFRGYRVDVTQGTQAVGGTLDADNSFASAALATFVPDLAITVTMRDVKPAPTDAGAEALTAEMNRRLAGERIPDGALRFRGDGIDTTVRDGVWSGTPAPRGGIVGQGGRQECVVTVVRSCLWICINPISKYFPRLAALCSLACTAYRVYECFTVDG